MSTPTPEPCKCVDNYAPIVPFHSGHCCFWPVTQTCHVQQVTAWRAAMDRRLYQPRPEVSDDAG